MGIAASRGTSRDRPPTLAGRLQVVQPDHHLQLPDDDHGDDGLRLGRHTRVNPQLYYYLGPFGLLAEWVHEYQQLANSVGSGAVNNSAGNVLAAFVIGGDETYEGVKPHKALDLANGGYGALEIGVRYNWLERRPRRLPDRRRSATSRSTARAPLGVALNWQLQPPPQDGRATSSETRFQGGAKRRKPHHREGRDRRVSRSPF